MFRTILVPIDLDETEITRSALEKAEALAECGLVVEPFGQGAVLVREAPALLPTAQVVTMVRDLAEEFLTDGDGAVGRRLDQVCSSIACHGSVRAGRRQARHHGHGGQLCRRGDQLRGARARRVLRAVVRVAAAPPRVRAAALARCRPPPRRRPCPRHTAGAATARAWRPSGPRRRTR